MHLNRGRETREADAVSTYSSRSPGVCRNLGAYACSLSTHDHDGDGAAVNEIPYVFCMTQQASHVEPVCHIRVVKEVL